MVGLKEEKKRKNRWGDPGAPCRASEGGWVGPPPWALIVLFKRKV